LDGRVENTLGGIRDGNVAIYGQDSRIIGETTFADEAGVSNDRVADLAKPFSQAGANAPGGTGNNCNFLFGGHDRSCSVGVSERRDGLI